MSDHFNNQAEWKAAEQLYEKGVKGEDLSSALNAIPYEERLSIAKKMQSVSELKGSQGLPELTIDFGFDNAGNEHLTDIHQKKWGPDKDIYNMPARINSDTLADARIEQAWESQGPGRTAEKQLEKWQSVQEELDPSVAQRLGK